MQRLISLQFDLRLLALLNIPAAMGIAQIIGRLFGSIRLSTQLVETLLQVMDRLAFIVVLLLCKVPNRSLSNGICDVCGGLRISRSEL